MMGKYIYRAVDDNGKTVKGMVDAASQADALAMVDKMGHTPVEIREESRAVPGRMLRSAFTRVRSEEMMIFYIQLYNMVNAGITILMSLAAIAEQVQNKKLKYVIKSLSDDIEKGRSFSDALARHRDIFPDLFINMVKNGEASGKLAIVLQSYATLYEEQLDLNQKIIAALFYPILLFCMGTVVITFLVTFIIPQFVKIFSESGIVLPLPTRIMYGVSIAIKRYWYLLVLGIAAAWYGLCRYLNTPAGRYRCDDLLLKVPVIGPLNRNVALARFSTTLSMLLKSGVPIVKSLELTGEVVQNSVLARVVSGAARAIERGENLTGPLRASGYFPATILQMAAVGEETGNLDGMLEKAGEFYAKAVANTIKKVTVVLEPLFLITLGSIVGFIMASIVLPLFKMVAIVKM